LQLIFRQENTRDHLHRLSIQLLVTNTLLLRLSFIVRFEVTALMLRLR
jgi:hypothetical protein